MDPHLKVLFVVLKLTDLKIITGATLFVLSLFVGTVAADDTSKVDHGCHGMALETCYLHVSGPITKQVADKVAAMLEEGVDGFKVLLNSDGGDLSAGLTLGRAIRSAGMETRIGVFNPLGFREPGKCLSACAYAFLGGTQRFVREKDRIGFHQFAVTGVSGLEGTGGLVVGQKISAAVIAYIVEMGVDARLFASASETAFSQMYFPSEAERIEYDIETPLGFGHFFMEPYGNGVVAVSRRLGPTHPYDRVDNLTAYCRSGRAHVLMTISGADEYVPDIKSATFEVGVSRSEPNGEIKRVNVNLEVADVRVWGTDKGAFIEMAFDASSVIIDKNAISFWTSMSTSRAAGGTYRTSVELNDMDRNMLRAAFRMCITS